MVNQAYKKKVKFKVSCLISLIKFLSFQNLAESIRKSIDATQSVSFFEIAFYPGEIIIWL